MWESNVQKNKIIKLVITANYFVLGKKHAPLLHFVIELPDGMGKHVGRRLIIQSVIQIM